MGTHAYWTYLSEHGDLQESEPEDGTNDRQGTDVGKRPCGFAPGKACGLVEVKGNYKQGEVEEQSGEADGNSEPIAPAYEFPPRERESK
jgi:hypothetical protein